MNGDDYFYQINDDVKITASNWAPTFINKLQNNPFLKNFGMLGPKDTK
jgi:hypothetical protein